MVLTYLSLKSNLNYKDINSGLIMDGNEWLEYFAEDCINNEVHPNQFYWHEFNYDKNLTCVNKVR